MQDTPEAERRLRDAVAECYAAFEKYHSKPDWVDAVVSGMTICPRKPAREFSPDEIEDHYLHATCFSGADREANHVQSTKFFLPRILEILSRPKRGGLGIVGQSEWLGEQWRLARWQDWQAEEREALEKWIDAWWYATLTVDLMGDLTKTLMCLPPNRNPIEVLPFALFSKDDPLLLWDNCGTVTAALQLAWMFVEGERSLQHGQLNGFGSGQEKVVVNWLLRKASSVRLERQFFNSDDALVQYWMSSGIEAFDRIIAAQQVLGIKGTEAG